MDESRLVKRAPVRPALWLGDAKEPAVSSRLGARFPAYLVKEADFVLSLPPGQRQR